MNANVAAKLIKKITPAVIADATGSPVNPNMPHPITAPRDLYDLFGIALKTRTGHTDKGDWLQFIGEFEAVTPDGEIFRSPRCHVPQPFEDLLFAQLTQAQATDGKASVQFAVRVSVVPPAKGKPSAVGYEYRVTPLIDSRDANPLALIKEQAYKAHPQLTHQSVRAVGGVKR